MDRGRRRGEPGAPALVAAGMLAVAVAVAFAGVGLVRAQGAEGVRVRATSDPVTFAAAPARTSPVPSVLPDEAPAPEQVVAAPAPVVDPEPQPAPAPPAPPPADAPAAVAPSGPIEPPADPRAPEPEIVLGTIDIPAIGLSVPLNQGIGLDSIDRGPSHWPGSALPGEVGNVVVAGHRVTKTEPFRHVDRLVTGDEVVLTVGGVRATYAVNGDEVVTPDAMRIVDPTPTPTVTLFACHPPGSARYRYVVTGDLVRTEPVAPAPG